MSNSSDSSQSNLRLLEIIKTQTDIAKLGLDLGAVMSLVAQRACALTAATGAVVELAEGDEMVYRATSGAAEPHLGLRLNRHASLSGLCVAQGEMLVCDDSDDDPRVNSETCRKIGLRSMIVVPLRHDDSVVGVLKVFAALPGSFGESDRQVLGLMSDLIAAAMYHATQNEVGALFLRATHDALAGLANRALFYDRLRHTLANASRDAKRFGVLNLDIDGLKPINDGLGHRAGDAAIREVATRIKQGSREADTTARVGGDEFSVILTQAGSRDEIRSHTERLSALIGAPFAFESSPMLLAASIGAAIYPDDGEDISTLMESSDRAMYAAKRSGRTGDWIG